MTSIELGKALKLIKRFATTAASIVTPSAAAPVPTHEDLATVKHLVGAIKEASMIVLENLGTDPAIEVMSPVDRDVMSALCGLGTTKDLALASIRKARSSFPEADFDTLLRAAVNSAAGR